MSPGGSLRLFIAASIPPDQLDWVEAQVAPLRELWPEARWAPRSNQHITLKFLGATTPEHVDDVVRACEVAAAARAASFLRLTELGTFPRPKSARVLWVGLHDPAGLLSALAADLDEALEPFGFAKEKRAYSAHLTVARFRQPVKIEVLPRLASPPPPFVLNGFGLWRSHLSPKGATYERLAEFDLVQN